MSESKAFHRLRQFMRLTDKMVDDASKNQIAEAARILALQISHYQRKFGVLPIDEPSVTGQKQSFNDSKNYAAGLPDRSVGAP